MLKLFRVTLPFFAMIIAGLMLAGCGSSDDAPSAPPPEAERAPAMPAPEPAPEPEPEPEHDPMHDAMHDQADDAAVEADPAAAAVSVDDDGVAVVTIGSTDQMQYTVRAFTVEAGQEVELTLVHEGRLPVEVMGHNVVILPAGENYMMFSRQVTTEGGTVENDYLPESMRDGVLAYTRMIGGGQSDTIRFTAPDEPGEYPFLCTFPGHFGAMNGVMTVL